ncbi:hypothetical protein ACQUFY_10800 [Robbsia andropogonis]|uniref:hypothetical protein n=1 Tax=Robbsia andropogonis TaxID=28092 RepID=UPI003D1AAD53
MSFKKTLAGALPFAHLLSNGPRAARAENDDDERKRRDDESDEDYAKRMDDLDEKERAADEKEKEDARRAEEEKEKEDARRAATEDGEDGDDESDDAKKAARATERARCARILAHGINIGAARQAGVFAFDTKMSSKAAIAALDAANADSRQGRGGLARRMEGTSMPKPGAGGAAASGPTLAQRIVQAGKVRRGEA